MDGFLTWWQHLPSTIDPVVLTVGGFSLRWYSLMWLTAFAVACLGTMLRTKIDKPPWTLETCVDAYVWMIVSSIIGGRLGYVLFYGWEFLLENPARMLLPFAKVDGRWQFTGWAGMAYHGGLVGILIGLWLFARLRRLPYFVLTDYIAVGASFGYFFGRLGNFLNGELYGRVTEAAIGMHFPNAPDDRLRHPSQLYEAVLEGPVLFVALWVLRKRMPVPGFLSGLYFLGYGVARFVVEFFREPDAHLGFILFNLSMGQLLCLALMAFGGIWCWIAARTARRGPSRRVG